MNKKMHTTTCDPYEYVVAQMIENSGLYLVNTDPETAPLFQKIKDILLNRVQAPFSELNCDIVGTECITYYEILDDYE